LLTDGHHALLILKRCDRALLKNLVDQSAFSTHREAQNKKDAHSGVALDSLEIGY
jgi:hypothetical protein